MQLGCQWLGMRSACRATGYALHMDVSFMQRHSMQVSHEIGSDGLCLMIWTCLSCQGNCIYRVTTIGAILTINDMVITDALDMRMIYNNLLLVCLAPLHGSSVYL
jgi:hypothetical protein